ncbi:MAG: hypothetical protein ACE5HK_04750 [Candidatus Methylomirabilales bacterium]
MLATSQIIVVGSRLPSCFRHYSLLHRRLIGHGKVLHHPGVSFKPKAVTGAVVEDGRPGAR